MKKDWEVFQVQPGEISDDDYSKGKELFDTSDPTLIKKILLKIESVLTEILIIIKKKKKR